MQWRRQVQSGSVSKPRELYSTKRGMLTAAHSALAPFIRQDERQPWSGEKILLNSSGLTKVGTLPTCTVDTIAAGAAAVPVDTWWIGNLAVARAHFVAFRAINSMNG